MKITRFGQSCVLLETKGKRILVDPGDKLWDESLLTEHWIDIDIILVTHKHHDHCESKSIQQIVNKDGAKFFTTQEVANAFPKLSPDIIKEGGVFKEDGLIITVVKAVHGYVPVFKGGKMVKENVGYIIDDGVKRVYLTSDTIGFENDYRCDVIFVPVCNHGLVMGPFEAALFAKETGAKLVIPNHYDNLKYPVDFKKVKEEFEKLGLNYKILQLKESIEI